MFAVVLHWILFLRGSFHYSINKLQNDIILLIFKIWQFGNIRFVENLIGDIYLIFCDDDVITVTSLVIRMQSVSAVFCPAVFFATRRCWRASWVKRKVSKFKKQSCLNIKHLMFYFSAYHSNIPITRWFDHVRESTTAIVASIVETTRLTGSSSSTTLSRPWSNFLHQTCIAGLVKYLSPYTGRISDWMAFALSPFAHSKRITEGCYYCGMISTATLPYLMFINDVTVTSS